jgi:glycosyltransferase involved in cell wall biosynthesis
MGIFQKRVVDELPICIFTAGRSCKQYVDLCIESVLKQSYSNFRHIIVDDCSTDGTAEQVRASINNDPRFQFHESTERLYVAGNTYTYLKPTDDEIVVTLDLDDWFTHDDVLTRVNQIYQRSNCWMSYGSYEHASNGRSGKICASFPKRVLKERSFRSHTWVTSHLRTFRGFLWNNLDKETQLRTPDGHFTSMAGDLAVMFPLLEMCQPGKIQYVKESLLIYNDLNPQQEHKVSRDQQVADEKFYRSLPKAPVYTGPTP